MQLIEKIIEYGRADTFYIYPLGDIHAGSIHCAEQKIAEKVEGIRQQRNAYWIGMGDYADSITQKDPRWDTESIADWVRKDNIAETERQFVVRLLKPIAKKCICMLTGNHEEAIHRHLQYDMTGNICRDLGVPYGGYSCFTKLNFKRKGGHDNHIYTFHCFHGAGSAQTEGARLMRLKRLVKEMQADVYFMGHLHAITHDITDRLTIQGNKIKSVPQIATITGSWLRTYTQDLPPSYGEMAGYKPSHLGCPCIIISPNADTIIYQA